MTEPKLKLCYVELPWAFFTTRELADQWGDDWDDAPYEHNADRPYEDWRSAREGKQPEWEVVQLAVETQLSPPCEPYSNSPWTVEAINRGEVPWLRDHYGKKHPPIMAGTTLPDFIRAIEASGGTVYRRTPAVSREELEKRIAEALHEAYNDGKVAPRIYNRPMAVHEGIASEIASLLLQEDKP